MTQLGSSSHAYTFLGRYDVEKLYIGKNVKAATTYAFYGAKSLKDVTVDPENKVLHATDNMLYAKGILIKYFSPSTVTEYVVPDDLKRIFNMDYTHFLSLDLNKVERIEKLSFAGSEIGILKLSDHPSINGNYDILYGAAVSEFDTSKSSVYSTDGKTLRHGNRLIKLAKNTTFESGYFDQFESISPYAFNSIAEYNTLKGMLPERLTKNVVFSFFVQDEGVFIVNNEIGFCYNYNLKIPTSVEGSVDYSPSIDAEKYDKIKALMYAGVPYDGTGLFYSIFEMKYEDVLCNPDSTEHGDAALNAVSAMIYRIIDSKSPAEIKGIGYGPFTEERVEQYIDALENAVSNYPAYNFVPKFAVKDNLLNFHKQKDGSYVSNEIIVNTLDGNGIVNNSYIYTINISTPGVTVLGSNETSFRTGKPIVLKSENKPSELSVTYNEPTLKYYKRTSNDVQNILVSATRENSLDLGVAVSADDIAISKQDATTGSELPGAHLRLEKDGVVIDDWHSSEIPHLITGVEDGEYTLTEITAPYGYEIAEQVVFIVKDGRAENGPIIMKDEPRIATPPDATPSEPDIPPTEDIPSESTPPPTVATPSEPAPPPTIATPSEPDPPSKDKPTESTPSDATPPYSRPTGGGGHSSGGSKWDGSGSESGPGIKRGVSPIPDIPKEIPIIESSPKEMALPKTGDHTVTSIISLSSLMTLIFLLFKRKRVYYNN